VVWWIVAVVAVVVVLGWLAVLAGRAPFRRRGGLDVVAAPEQTPGLHAPGPLTTDVDDGKDE
jgi:hypothetical protein